MKLNIGTHSIFLLKSNIFIFVLIFYFSYFMYLYSYIVFCKNSSIFSAKKFSEMSGIAPLFSSSS